MTDRCEVLRRGRRCKGASHLLFKGKGVCEGCWDRLMDDKAPPGAIYQALGMGEDYEEHMKQYEASKRERKRSPIPPGHPDYTGRRKVMAKVRKKKATKKATKRSSNGSGKGRAGKTSGLKVAEFWEKLMSGNFKTRATDEQLCKAMNKEFPSDTPYDVADVKAHRSLFNKGKLRFQKSKPKQPLHEFDSNKNAIPLWGQRGKLKKGKGVAKDDVKFAATTVRVKRTRRAKKKK